MASPLKIDDRTDQLASHGAHFLGITKKQYVAEAVELYTEHRRAEIEQGVKAALEALDGGNDAGAQLLSGLIAKKLEELGGLGGATP